jgi:hypothetical protein
MAQKRKMRMEAAKLARELEEKQEQMTPEEIEAMEASIPEWKRNAIVMTGDPVTEDKPGMFGKLKGKISDTDAAKKFKDSEEYDRL